jgi:hypothetical protein
VHFLTALGLSPYRWVWRQIAAGAAAPDALSEEEGVLMLLVSVCSVRWSGWAAIGQILSAVFLFHERFLFCLRPQPLPLLRVTLLDIKRQMSKEWGDKYIRDALRPREVGATIQKEIRTWRLPALADFVWHPPQQFTLTQDTPASPWSFVK